MTRTPMPSPRGTNRENLYLPSRTAAMALDAAPRRRAHDATIQDAVEQLVAPFRGKVSGPLLLQLQAELADVLANGGEIDIEPAEPDDDDIAADGHRVRLGADARLRKVVADAKSKVWARQRAESERLFPGLARIRQA